MDNAIKKNEAELNEASSSTEKHDPHAMRALIRRLIPNDNNPLSHRETEILREISTGKSRSKIAKALFIDAETVKSHTKAIYRKLKVHYKADAIKIATLYKYI